MTGITPQGVAFLKCAFAAPDFNVDPGKGIPDRYEGKTLVRKDNATQAKTFTANKTTWILVLPTPGKAYWTAETSLGANPSTTTEFIAVDYPGALDLFGNSNAQQSRLVDEFRYASMAFGIYPTSNMMQYGGSISVWKCMIKWGTANVSKTIATIPPTSFSITEQTVVGTAGVLATGRDNFTTGFNNGVYTMSTAEDENFPFWPVRAGHAGLPPAGTSVAEADMSFRLDAGGSAAAMVGCDGMESIVIRVDTPSGAVNAAVLKAWACMEYKVVPNSTIEQYAGLSAPYDPVALTMYRRIANNLPVAVRACDNAWLWDRIRNFLVGAGTFVRQTAGVARHIPGPIGEVATHVSGLADLMGSLGL